MQDFTSGGSTACPEREQKALDFLSDNPIKEPHNREEVGLVANSLKKSIAF